MTISQLQPRLNGRHQHTYDTVFRHPLSHNLEWHDLRSLLDAVADVVEGINGSLRATRNGLTVALHAPQHAVATGDDVLAVRSFLERSGTPGLPADAGTHLLVVIDHHEAKVYHTEMRGAVPERLVPYDPHGHGQHLRSKSAETDGKRKPEQKSYYESVAAALRGADRVLIFGSGTGESSAMEFLLADLKVNHPDVAARVVGSVVIDAGHTTEGQLLAQARAFFATERA